MGEPEYVSSDGRTVKHQKKPSGLFRRRKDTGQAFPISKTKKIIFPKVDDKGKPLGKAYSIGAPASHLIHSPQQYNTKLQRQVVVDYIERLEDNKEILIKDNKEKYEDNRKRLQLALDSLSKVEELKNREQGITEKVTTPKPTPEEKKEIKKIQQEIKADPKKLDELINGGQAELIFKSLNIDKDGRKISDAEKNKLLNTATFVNHLIQTEREDKDRESSNKLYTARGEISKVPKLKEEHTRELFALGKLRLYEDALPITEGVAFGFISSEIDPSTGKPKVMADRPQFGIDSLDRAIRLPSASQTPKEIEASKTRNRLMAGMTEGQKKDYLEKLQTTTPVLNTVFEEPKVKTDAELKRRKTDLESMRKRIVSGEFKILPENEKKVRLDAVNSQLKRQQEIMQVAKNSDTLLPADKRDRIEAISKSMRNLFGKKKEIENLDPETIQYQHKDVKLKGNEQEIQKIEKELAFRAKMRDNIPNSANAKSTVANNIALSQSSKSKLQLIAEMVTKRKLGEDTTYLESELEKAKSRENNEGAGIGTMRDQQIQSKGIYASTSGEFKACSRCSGAGVVGQGKMCKTCQGSGSAKQSDILKASGKFASLGYKCKDCSNKRGFRSELCKKCQGRTKIGGQSTLIYRAGKEFEDQSRARTTGTFAELKGMNADQTESKLDRAIKPPASNLIPVTKNFGAIPRTVWVDARSGETPDNINPSTGQPKSSIVTNRSILGNS